MKIILSPLARRLYNCLSKTPKTKWELQSELTTWDERGKEPKMPPEREVRDAINELRMAGFPIVSNSKSQGYWKGSKEEVMRTVKEFRSRERSAREVADAMEKGPDIGQMEMEL